MAGSTTCEGCIANPQKRAKIPSQMAKTPANPSFSVIPPRSIEPPRPLGQSGRELWEEIQAEYQIADSGGCELLAQAAAALDTAEAVGRGNCRRWGPSSAGKTAAREAHPAIRDQLGRPIALSSGRLQRLGVNVSVEPTRPPGRPPKPYGW